MRAHILIWTLNQSTVHQADLLLIHMMRILISLMEYNQYLVHFIYQLTNSIWSDETWKQYIMICFYMFIISKIGQSLAVI